MDAVSAGTEAAIAEGNGEVAARNRYWTAWSQGGELLFERKHLLMHAARTQMHEDERPGRDSTNFTGGAGPILPSAFCSAPSVCQPPLCLRKSLSFTLGAPADA